MNTLRFQASHYEAVSTAAAAAGAMASMGDFVAQEPAEGVASTAEPSALQTVSTAAGGRHLSQTGFLGLNWRSIGAAVVVGTLVAVGTELALGFIRPRVFKKKYGKGE